MTVLFISRLLGDPAAADYDIAVIENCSLSRCDGALGLVEGGEDFVVAYALDYGRGGLVAMANLHRHPHRLVKIVDRDQVYAAGAQGARVEMLFPADDDLLISAADLDDVERRAGGYAESLALADGEVVNAGVLAENFAGGGDEVAGGVGQGLALLGEVSVDEALVV